MGGTVRANRLIKEKRNKGIVIQIGSFIDNDKLKYDYIYVKPHNNKKIVYAVSYGSDVYISKDIRIGDNIELVAMKFPYGYAWIKKNEPCEYIKKEGINREYIPFEIDSRCDCESDVEEVDGSYIVTRFI